MEVISYGTFAYFIKNNVAKIFNEEFVELARSVYFTNDERAKVKNDINKTCGSELVEGKSYEEY